MLLPCLSIAAATAGALPAPAGEPATEQGSEIIVTGERVRSSVKETASSVSVVTAREIEAQPLDRVEDFLAFVPNVQLGSGSQGPAIRGLDTTGALQALPAFLGGNRPRTTMVVDGRPTTYNEFVFGAEPAWDVERIEVFRSPQTTTQGQNSIAGAIFVFTEDPAFEPEYRVRGIAGNFRTRQLSALASGPVGGDSVAFRVAGDFRYSRTTSEIADRAVGADPNHDVYGLLRGKLLIAPAALPGTSAVVSFTHQQSQAPQAVRVTQPFRERRDASGFYGTFRNNVDSLTARVRHEDGPLSATLTLSAGDTNVQRLAFTGLGQAQIAGRDWSAEAVANWSPDGAVRIVGGISARHNALRQKIDLSALSGVPHFRDRQDALGLFGEARVQITPKATLSAGLRYQHDRQRRAGAFETANGPIALDYDRSFDALLPKVSLSYDVSAAVTAGLLVQKAYNPGGTTLRFDIGEPDMFEAETLWDYEAFVRAGAAGGRLSLSANAFYYAMRNAQRAKDIDIIAPNGLTVGFSDLFNVPRARSYGLEGEARWRASDRLEARLALGVLRTRIVRSGAGYEEFEGRDFDRSPHFTAAAAVDWRPLDRLRLSAQMRHRGPYSSDPTEAPLTRVTGTSTIADARGEYDAGAVAVFAYARNLFDTFSIRTRDAVGAELDDPREVGVGLEARF